MLGSMNAADGLILSGHDVALVAAALNLTLAANTRNGRAPSAAACRVAAKVAVAAPTAAVALPSLMNAAGPEARAAVIAQVRSAAGSRPALEPVLLGASEAARRAGVSDRAIRGACQDRRLTASKSECTGEWRIRVTDLDRWMEERDAA
jgi:hypothetical protein